MGLSPNSGVYPWKTQHPPWPFVQLLLAELGNMKHLDRPAIFKARPNRMKGAMFGGLQSTALTKYIFMDEEQQLLAVKEMGMVLNYPNSLDIWSMFCDTYEALYGLMGDFDGFYAGSASGVAILSLQDE
ncbi:hypothetical protein EDB81DRAFT_666247 [Dactylonectria macrodidyma]|uniref:Uncharacterized protein n=1 Tax=Dactylonectria macrodidyma TaxID=307937 RepID=A0A9P9IIE3_9HYPO|nr:hypothetical protein EDB81DRAFT_666247 [Dactylonectria macrodidyma]